MTRTAVIYRWNSLRRQYKSESPVGNPLFPGRSAGKSGDLRDRFLRGDRLIQFWLSGSGFEETSRTRQQKVERRNAFPDVETSATGGQKQQREAGCALDDFAGGFHVEVL